METKYWTHTKCRRNRPATPRCTDGCRWASARVRGGSLTADKWPDLWPRTRRKPGKSPSDGPRTCRAPAGRFSAPFPNGFRRRHRHCPSSPNTRPSSCARGPRGQAVRRPSDGRWRAPDAALCVRPGRSVVAAARTAARTGGRSCRRTGSEADGRGRRSSPTVGRNYCCCWCYDRPVSTAKAAAFRKERFSRTKGRRSRAVRRWTGRSRTGRPARRLPSDHAPSTRFPPNRIHLILQDKLFTSWVNHEKQNCFPINILENEINA